MGDSKNANTSFTHAVEEVFFLTPEEQQRIQTQSVVAEIADEFSSDLLTIVRPVLLLTYCQLVTHGLAKDRVARVLSAFQRGVFHMAAQPNTQRRWFHYEDHGWHGFPASTEDGSLYSTFMWQLMDNKTIQLGLTTYNRRYDFVNDVVHGSDSFDKEEWRLALPPWPATVTTYQTVQLYSRLRCLGTTRKPKGQSLKGQ